MIKLSQCVDKKMIKFIMVGIVNTIIGTGIMFVAYNIFHFSYWVSSAMNYIIGSIISYGLNKSFTFKSQERSSKSIIKFIINIVICYIVAYGVAKPLIFCIFVGVSQKTRDNLSMMVGMVIFVAINYIGQRYFVFKNSKLQ